MSFNTTEPKASSITMHEVITVALIIAIVIVSIILQKAISTRRNIQTQASTRQDENNESIIKTKRLKKLSCSDCIQNTSKKKNTELCFDKKAKASYCNEGKSNYSEGVMCVSCTTDSNITPTPPPLDCTPQQVCGQGQPSCPIGTFCAGPGTYNTAPGATNYGSCISEGCPLPL